MNLESSVVSSMSKSVESVSGKKNILISGLQKPIDIVFPLFDQMNTIAKVPKMVMFIVSLFFDLQAFLVSMWPISNAFDLSDPTHYPVLHWALQIFWFTNINDIDSSLQYQLIIAIVAAILSVGWLGFELFYYKVKKSFITWSLWVQKVIFDIITPICLYPCASLVSFAFKTLHDTGNNKYWVHLVLGAVCYVVLFAITSIAMTLSSRTVILTNTPFPLVDHRLFINHTMINSLMIVVSFILSIFPNYYMVIVYICHILANVYILTIVTNFPFYKILDNAIYCSITVSTIIMDLLFIGNNFMKAGKEYLRKWIPFIVGCALLVVLTVAFYYMFFFMAKKIKKQFKYTSNEMTEEEKYAVFDELKLDQSENKAMKYLYVSFVQMGKMFVDMSYVAYLTNHYDSNRVLCCLAQVVAFFPSEMRKLNNIFKMIISQRNLTFGDRFVVFQIGRIRALRASSVSIDANEKILVLRNLNNECEAMMRHFWNLPNPKISFCEKVSSTTSNALLLWNEAINHYPNNAKISYEYSRFRSETMADLEGAIYQQERGDQIEVGRNFAVDASFRSFIRMFPSYILNNVLDEKGKRIMKKQVNNGKGSQSMQTSGSNSSQRSLNSSSNDITIDAEMEESIGKKIFNHSRMRLALHHALETRKSSIRKYFIIFSFITLIATIAIFVFFNVFQTEKFKIRKESVVYINSATRMRFLENVAIFQVWAHWAKNVGRISNWEDSFKAYWAADKSTFTEYVKLDEELPTQITSTVKDAASEFDVILGNLANLAAEGINVYTMASTLVSETCDFRFCYNSSDKGDVKSTFKDKYIYMLHLNKMIAGTTDVNGIFTANDFCELMRNSDTFPIDVSTMFTSFLNSAQKDGEDLRQILSYLQIAAPIIALIISFVPICVTVIAFVHSVNKTLKILSSMDDEAKEGAKLPIRKDIEVTQNASSENIKAYSFTLLSIIIYFVFAVAITVTAFLFAKEMGSSNDTISKISQWFYYAASRSATTGETIVEIMNVIVLSGPDPPNVSFMNISSNKDRFTTDLESILNNNEYLLRGTDDSPAFSGYDTEIDKLHYAELCTANTKATDMHDLYRCASATHQLAVFKDLANEVQARPEYFGGRVNITSSLNLMHIVTGHLWYTLFKINSKMVDLVEQRSSKMKRTNITCTVIGVVIALANVGMTLYLVSRADGTYVILIALIKRLQPANIVASKPLMDFLLNRKSREDDKSMSISQSVVRNCADCIIYTGVGGMIEMTNPAVSTILGYTPDQLLGQPIGRFFRSDDSEKLEKQMELMKNKQSGSTYEDKFTCISDSAREVSFQIRLIGMKNEGSDDISSFVFIMSDITKLLKQMKEAEDAKQKSETLLFQILPKDIVVRLGRGEKDISFTVPSASIIFIDIVKFSEYAASLTPQEIMGNLSTVFAAFDEMVKKYPKITKIKLIGDVYMAAAGLFDEQDDPASHAKDMVNFGLDCLGELDEVNVKLNASLEVRIGINTGGPLLAGVLGTDKPVFDIIGDPINIAARLQSTDIAGRIQISKATKEYIENSNFNIEERGEVFLKGKGKQMTYLVTPLSGMMHITSSLSQSKLGA
ncbi:Adenylate and Guanylate cyclase catalytic domain containing protein [Trichomonas vaginalis G3]|uniref:Adenylate and Guanylate cyclase catalytic domain containing protein n=1 Tax=Trichomonas vaginalis (strain ATCC PRA-98 / G3) TaxID=412133 RepID=A2EQT4_TRIV3|nr:guanylate cyclase protein [Trichomonas vaginalis G3]EAY04980.1 Adenylate and Guanylate cyclase catalytic domain containing protein [Trichomonas vaginalis G3]KAI5553504.1 guanylate cyclase protein [Trichomonas vaginalis G3]|eukprot:XP_001317203.1 Adenylate and Guanylate cyclase catalytic domain containing protein [Trichomonas vaginalis G3]